MKNASISRRKTQVMGNPLYVNHYISQDARVAAVIIETEASVEAPVAEEELLQSFAEVEKEVPGGIGESHYFSAKENREVVEAVNRVVQRHQSKDFLLTAYGGQIGRAHV